MGTLKYPASIDWEVTPFCNHQCLHCYNCWRTNEDRLQDIAFNQDVTEEYYLHTAKLIKKNQPVSVIITGGEPLSVFWKIDTAIEYLLKAGIYVSMNTNLTLIDDAIAKRIKKLGIHLFTSIPSVKEETCEQITGIKGAFHAIDKGIRKCLEYEIPLATNMVVTKINMPDIFETAQYIKSLGLDYFCCTKAAFPANAQEKLKEEILSHSEFSQILTNLILIGHDLDMQVDSAWAYSLCGLNETQIDAFGFKRRCGAGRFNFAITCTGDIKACNVDTEIYGNIYKCEMYEAMERMVSWQDNTFLPLECKECNSLYLCGGGCRLEAQNTFGNKCGLDSTANIQNKERILLPPSKHYVNRSCQYELNNEVRIIEEATCYRISRRSQYEFITKECKLFFEEFTNFTFDNFMVSLSLDDELAETEFSEFIDKGFIKIKS